ncbi:hypothetical protein QEH42_gp164 [Microbacterium phage Pumpernickel]|uniref:Uncharacterized protein n=1 Tax=Microbacterium phage Pumpernickel TaxID=2885983 RepID=A0AAE9C3M2_9CAUD|nr:hypothetical protein QEH42_gp003 [Microbacterium phage Pumpernickel]YP_010755294.1 hypothetical protein QEH42_gp164 [Microbacterium phage Pumpernickel]UDL15794.1 hypothetical protein SEA_PUMPERNICKEL_3 [Microbacterium phage Pumpernickel]UDL16054.1 hypothetical protein SEA_PUMPERNICKEL_304 [Microbacterium phage Pumpernickel]
MTLLPTRLETLRGIADGTVTLKYVNDHKKYKYEPCQHAINGSFLEKAQLVEADPVFRVVELTERGKVQLALAES